MYSSKNKPIAYAFGMQIDDIRRQKKMDQKRLSALSGVSLKTIHRITMGEPVNLDSLLSVISALGYKLEIVPLNEQTRRIRERNLIRELHEIEFGT